MNFRAAIFDFIALEVANKFHPIFLKSLSHTNAESSGNSLLTNILHAPNTVYDSQLRTNNSA